MADERFDVLVVGSGPAGSVAALVLARGGARVALVDKAPFPRDKACGDLIGPRGVQLLIDLDLTLRGALPVGDMLVIGPTGRRIRLPSASGFTYPGYGLAVRRADLDALLHDAAVDAGAESIQAQAIGPLDGGRGLEGFELSNGMRVRADAIVGADGATSRVAQAAGLVDARRVLWGFALRSYARRVGEVSLDRVVGRGSLARASRLRLAVPGARRSGQPRARRRDARGSHGGSRRAARLMPRSSITCTARPPRRPSVAGPARRLAQDGDGRDRADGSRGSAGR